MKSRAGDIAAVIERDAQREREEKTARQERVARVIADLTRTFGTVANHGIRNQSR